jgi:hypothetical protein
MGERLGAAVAALTEASRWLGGALVKNPQAALAGAQPYLRLFGLAAGGVYLARGALAVSRDANAGAANPRIVIARYFAEQLAAAAPGLKDTIVTGADAVLALEPDALAG